jgi:hypothetical protein
MFQMPLPFSDKEDSPANERTIRVMYENSDFDTAIAGAHEAYDEQVAVIAIPAGCPLVPMTMRPAKS